MLIKIKLSKLFDYKFLMQHKNGSKLLDTRTLTFINNRTQCGPLSKIHLLDACYVKLYADEKSP